MFRRILAWIFSALFLLLVAWVVATSPTFQSCVQKEEHEAATQQFQGSAARLIAIYRPCTSEFVHGNGEAIIAVFTIILAFSTIFLWGATRDLVKEAEGSSRRQLRAYLSIDPTFIENYGTKNRVTFNCDVVNHGQTPAFDISYVFTSTLMPERLPDGWEYTPPQRKVEASSTCFPKRRITAWFHHEAVLTHEEFKNMETGAYRLYVWGVMTYSDAFKRTHETQFNFSIGGSDFVQTMQNERSARTVKGKRAEVGPGYVFVHGPKHGHAT